MSEESFEEKREAPKTRKLNYPDSTQFPSKESMETAEQSDSPSSSSEEASEAVITQSSQPSAGLKWILILLVLFIGLELFLLFQNYQLKQETTRFSSTIQDIEKSMSDLQSTLQRQQTLVRALGQKALDEEVAEKNKTKKVDGDLDQRLKLMDEDITALNEVLGDYDAELKALKTNYQALMNLLSDKNQDAPLEE